MEDTNSPHGGCGEESAVEQGAVIEVDRPDELELLENAKRANEAEAAYERWYGTIDATGGISDE